MIDQKIFEVNEELRARLKEELRQELLNEEEGGDDERTMMIVIEIDKIKRGMIADAIVSVEHITTFVEGVANENDSSISSQYIRQIAIREKLYSPALIINYESLSKL